MPKDILPPQVFDAGQDAVYDPGLTADDSVGARLALPVFVLFVGARLATPYLFTAGARPDVQNSAKLVKVPDLASRMVTPQRGARHSLV